VTSEVPAWILMSSGETIVYVEASQLLLMGSTVTVI